MCMLLLYKEAVCRRYSTNGAVHTMEAMRCTTMYIYKTIRPTYGTENQYQLLPMLLTRLCEMKEICIHRTFVCVCEVVVMLFLFV